MMLLTGKLKENHPVFMPLRSKIDRRSAILALSGAVFSACRRSSRPIIVGGKDFTEQRILKEVIAQHLERSTHLKVRRSPGVTDADDEIEHKKIDVYVEYSGTALIDILGGDRTPDDAMMTDTIRPAYRKRGLEWFDSLGFRDDFAIVIRKADSDKYGIRSLADASLRPAWRVADGPGFELRPDGLAMMLTKCKIHLSQPPLTRKVDELYKMLEDERVDMIAANSTDRLLGFPSFVHLDDSARIFPPYDAAVVARIEMLDQHPQVRPALQQLSGRISELAMQAMNGRFDEVLSKIRTEANRSLDDQASDLDDQAAALVAATFLDNQNL
jgi:osmoprotectant transport system substrate-binding protein